MEKNNDGLFKIFAAEDKCEEAIKELYKTDLPLETLANLHILFYRYKTAVNTFAALRSPE